jgi:hypothetical protein
MMPRSDPSVHLPSVAAFPGASMGQRENRLSIPAASEKWIGEAWVSEKFLVREGLEEGLEREFLCFGLGSVPSHNAVMSLSKLFVPWS